MTIRCGRITTGLLVLLIASFLGSVTVQSSVAEPVSVSTAQRKCRAVKTILIPGKPSKDLTAFDLVSRADSKLSHHRVSVGDYTFVPTVGKCWNVGSYKLRRGNQTLSSGRPNPSLPDWANNTYYTVVTPLVVPSRDIPQQKLGNCPANPAAKIKTPLKVLAPGSNMFGSGSPELIIEYAECGAHCLFRYTAFSLGTKFKKMFTIDSGNDPLNFVDLGGDGSVEAIGWDQTFVSWNCSTAYSPRPQIVICFKPDKVALATKYMKTPPPTPQYMDKIVAETIKAFQPAKEEEPGASDEALSDDIALPSELVNNMLTLIYSGNADAAWRFLDRVWPARNPRWQESLSNETLTKEKYLVEFKKQLATSPYWPEIKKMNDL